MFYLDWKDESPQVLVVHSLMIVTRYLALHRIDRSEKELRSFVKSSLKLMAHFNALHSLT
jgi:hypothetical protein